MFPWMVACCYLYCCLLVHVGSVLIYVACQSCCFLGYAPAVDCQGYRNSDFGRWTKIIYNYIYICIIYICNINPNPRCTQQMYTSLPEMPTDRLMYINAICHMLYVYIYIHLVRDFMFVVFSFHFDLVALSKSESRASCVDCAPLCSYLRPCF
jgi:hypothetical protein